MPAIQSSKELKQMKALQIQMEVTVERLQQDMEHVIARMATIEKLVTLTSKHDKVIPPQVTTQFLCSKNEIRKKN